jgi:hypothetical protein
VRKLMLLGTGPRGGNPDSDPGVLERAPRPVPTLEDFLFLFFGRSEAAQQAGRDFWARRHQRVTRSAEFTGGDPGPDRVEHVLPAEAGPQGSVRPPSRDQPADLHPERRDDVMIPTINSWHMAQNIPNAQLFVYPDAGHARSSSTPSAS